MKRRRIPTLNSNHDCAPLRVACRTLGCRLNSCDTEAIMDALRLKRPISAVAWHDTADLYLLASCTVTAKAAQECRRLARQVKARQPQAKVVVTGCYAQMHPDELAAMPEVDAVLGQTAKNRVDGWLGTVLDGRQRPILVEPLTERGPLSAPQLGSRQFGLAGHSRAFLKIQDGCDHRCAYCQIWQARGPARSLPKEDVAAQVRHLRDVEGFLEVVLSGIHLGAWGRDLLPRSDVCELLAFVCAEFPDLRLRLSSMHPDEVTPGLLAVMADRKRLRPHLHLSVQSGSDGILERMRRTYRSGQVEAVCRALAHLDPLFGLGADFIVGFPGESEDDFQATLALCEQIPFSYLHVFPFSARPGTPAAAMQPVPAAKIRRRAAELRHLGRLKQAAFASRMLGTVREAVLERADHRGPAKRRATLDNYAVAYLTSDRPAGTLIMARITDQRDGQLEAVIEEVVQEGRR